MIVPRNKKGKLCSGGDSRDFHNATGFQLRQATCTDCEPTPLLTKEGIIQSSSSPSKGTLSPFLDLRSSCIVLSQSRLLVCQKTYPPASAPLGIKKAVFFLTVLSGFIGWTALMSTHECSRLPTGIFTGCLTGLFHVPSVVHGKKWGIPTSGTKVSLTLYHNTA
ncbi:hypothetical protein ACLOJK_039704 [Asimina triloba]